MAAFEKFISKTEIAQLPQLQFKGKIVVAASPEQIAEACRELQRHEALGIDTERRPGSHRGSKHPVSLVQLATADKAFLLRTNRQHLEPPLLHLLQDPAVLKIGLALQHDLPELKQLGLQHPQGFVELHDLAHEAGIREVGLAPLTALILEGRLSKDQQQSDWEAARYTPEQLTYAATDAWVCLKMYQRLQYLGFA